MASPETAGRTVIVSGVVACDDLTVPADRAIHMVPGGRIDVGAGKTLVIDGLFEAGRFPCFGGEGQVRLASGSVKEVYPEWFNDDLSKTFDTACRNNHNIRLTKPLYTTSRMISPRQTDADPYWYGARVYGQGRTEIRYTGPADPTAAVFGYHKDQAGSLMNCTFENITFNANGLAGYCLLVEPTNQKQGLRRRENENNKFVSCLFHNATRILVAFGDPGIRDMRECARESAAGADLNVNQNTFRGCTFYHANEGLVKLVGGNVYNTLFDSCFLWAGNTKPYVDRIRNAVIVIGSRKHEFFNCFFGPFTNDTADESRGRMVDDSGNVVKSFFYLDGATVDLTNCQSEEPRLLYMLNNESCFEHQIVMRNVTINNPNPGSYCIYGKGQGKLTVQNCNFGYRHWGPEAWRKAYWHDVLIWESSYLSKFGGHPQILLGNPSRCRVDGRALDDSLILNPNFNMQDWSSGLPDGFTTAADGGSAGSIAESSSYAENGTRTAALTVSQAGEGKGHRFVLPLSDYVGVSRYVGKTLAFVATGYTTLENFDMAVCTTSGESAADIGVTGESGGRTWKYDGNRFVAVAYRTIVPGDTMVEGALRVRETGTVYIDTFAAYEYDYNLSTAFAKTKYAQRTNRHVATKRVSGHGGTVQVYTETLRPYAHAMYLVGANRGDGTHDTALILVSSNADTVSARKLGDSGTAALIGVSCRGLELTITIDGTVKAVVQKINTVAE